ncbi:MAG TPA: structural protein [Gallionellaceae bacterium]
MLTPRGIRNNNPGNIRLSGTTWQGMAPQQTDGSFIQFISPEYGIRAISKILDSYSTKYNLNTIRGIITRWAPPNENDTDAYVEAVADAVGVDPDVRLEVSRAKPQIIAAIIQHENGQQPYNLAQIDSGVRMA